MVHKTTALDLVEQNVALQGEKKESPYNVVVTSTEKGVTLAYHAASGEMLPFDTTKVEPSQKVSLEDDAPAGGNAYGVKVSEDQLVKMMKLRMQ